MMVEKISEREHKRECRHYTSGLEIDKDGLGTNGNARKVAFAAVFHCHRFTIQNTG